MKLDARALLLQLGVFSSLAAGQAPTLSKEVRELVAVEAPVVVLRHARVIDGTGASAKEDQTLVLSGGRIEKLGGGRIQTEVAARAYALCFAAAFGMEIAWEDPNRLAGLPRLQPQPQPVNQLSIVDR